MKIKKKYHTVGIVLGTETKSISLTHIYYIHDRSLCWLDTCTGTSIKSGSVKPVSWT